MWIYIHLALNFLGAKFNFLMHILENIIITPLYTYYFSYNSTRAIYFHSAKAQVHEIACQLSFSLFAMTMWQQHDDGQLKSLFQNNNNNKKQEKSKKMMHVIFHSQKMKNRINMNVHSIWRELVEITFTEFKINTKKERVDEEAS